MLESEWVKRLRSRPGTEMIGDDAAVLGATLVSTDMLMDGVDFLADRVEPEWIGRKALAVNLSDIAAMGGVPTDVLVSLALPKRRDDPDASWEIADRLYNGMEPLLEKYRVRLAGGDTNRWSGGLVVSITVLGTSGQEVWRRGGGKPGDMLLVTGPLGGSILRHQFFFEPRVFEAGYLNGRHRIDAAIDLSDGLSLDLHRLAAESGLGAVLDADSIPLSDDARRLSETSGRSPLEHALSDGEDFELLLAVPETESKRLLETQPLLERFGTRLYRIGMLTSDPGLVLSHADGTSRPLRPEGFEH